MLTEARTCLRLLTPVARSRVIKLIPLTVIAGLVEAMGAAAVFALVTILGNPSRAASMPGASLIYRHLSNHEPHTVMLTFTVLVVVFYVVRNALLVLQVWVQERSLTQTMSELAHRLLDYYMLATRSFHLRHHSSLLIQRIQSIPLSIRMALSSLIALIAELLAAVGIVAVLLIANPWVTLASVTISSSLIVASLVTTRRAFSRWSVSTRILESSLLKDLQQILGATLELGFVGKKTIFMEHFDSDQKKLARINESRSTLAAAQRLLIETIFISAVLLVSLLVARRQSANDIVPLLGLYAYAGFRLLPSVNRILLYASNLRIAGSTLREIDDDLMLTAPSIANDQTAHIAFTKSIKLSSVTFAYEGTHKQALCGVNLTISKGQCIGIVGPSGAGKSTLVNIVLGLLEPTSGVVTVDGEDIRHGLPTWHRHIGYVPQEPYMLDDTLRRNVAFGLLDADIDDDRVKDALHKAQLDDLLKTFPEKLDTMLGEHGAYISGGQRQRVAIARALYHDRDVLVLDEATSALDGETELQFRHILNALRRDKTIIVITHRPSMVCECDDIVVLDNGKIATMGNWNELMSTYPHFRRMASLTAKAV